MFFMIFQPPSKKKECFEKPNRQTKFNSFFETFSLYWRYKKACFSAFPTPAGRELFVS